MGETAPLRLSDRLIEIALGAELYGDVDLAPLWRNPLQQIAREHLLCQTILDRGFADVAMFVVVAPAMNHNVQDAVASYTEFLTGPRQGRVHFVNVSLERIIECYAAVKHEAFARMLHRRYLDLWLIDGELGLDDAPDPNDAGVAMPVDLPAAA